MLRNGPPAGDAGGPPHPHLAPKSFARRGSRENRSRSARFRTSERAAMTWIRVPGASAIFPMTWIHVTQLLNGMRDKKIT